MNNKDMDDSIKLWIQELSSGKNPQRNFIFAKAKYEDNTILFYTNEGVKFYEVTFESRLPVEMFSDDILVGVIYPDYPNKNPEGVSMTAKIVANPRGYDKQNAELVKFRAEMLQKIG